MLYTLACGSVFLLAFLAFANPMKVNVLANRWLGLFLFCLGCTLLGRALPGTAAVVHYPKLPGLLELTQLAMAPALYLSAVLFTAPQRDFRPTDALHFLPWLLFLCYLTPLLLPGQPPGQLPLPGWAALLLRNLIFASTKVQAVAYWVAAYVCLVRHQRHIRRVASQLEYINLQWLRHVLWGLAVLVLLWMNELFLHLGWALALTPVSYLVAVYYVAYCALRQREVFAFPAPARAELQELLQEADAPLAEPDVPARQPRLSATQLQYWQERLRQLLATEKVYLEADLGLPGLAQKAGLTTHELSFVLNEGFGVNFFQFINGYRVEEAKRLLASAQHQHLSMVGIAFEAGFSSKTTFNTTFKKVTGLSPSQFVQAQRAGTTPSAESPGDLLPPIGAAG
ncbi:helix-turn-helix domain-containing protein [Hymenobacter negativus]|uniref:AraC family transcriptional regulator n=1 Tax=Hymenobacter negativus TaxID=2795026 RepID=A0ABS3Q9D8_9BACT|nr:helix-turn-helix domain-containing protein [Hymenobacter negativus]MBO2007832.1 AraC family transcriptional regulator [Hymenobacter negativus]